MCIHLSQYKNTTTYCNIFEYCFMNTINFSFSCYSTTSNSIFQTSVYTVFGYYTNYDKTKTSATKFWKPSSTYYVTTEIPGNLLQQCIKLIKKPLILIYNVFFFKSSIFPDKLKIVKVKPLHKKWCTEL